MDIYSLTVVQCLSYSLMFVLLACACALHFEARARARELRRTIKKLQLIREALNDGLPVPQAMAEAGAIVAETELRGLFRRSARLAVSGGIRDQVDEIVTACLGRLNDAVMANELAGPRFGLALTAAAIVVRFSSQGAASEFGNVGIAVITTGLGMLVSIISSWTLNRTILPLANELREVATAILALATWPDEPRRVTLVEITHDAA